MLFASVMTSAAMWAAIVGFFSPVVIQQINKAFPNNRQTQAVIAFLWSVIVGAGTAYFAAELDVKDVVQSVLIVFVAAIAAYHGLWNNTPVAPTTTDDPGV